MELGVSLNSSSKKWIFLIICCLHLSFLQTPEQLQNENVPQHLIPHKTFSGNRPSLSLLLPSLDA
ncbi:unnamed protein product, partial [Vitis vinifera]